MSLYNLIVKNCTKIKPIDSYDSFLFIGPHPDDIEMGCGALAMKLAQQKKHVVFLICTDGRYGNKFLQDKTQQEIIEIRKNEVYSSALALSVTDVRLLNYSDGGFYDDKEMSASIAQVIGNVKPDVIFVTDPDVKNECHPDHIRIGRICKNLFAQTKNSEIVKNYNSKPATVSALALYLTDKPNQYIRSKEFFQNKLFAIFQCHKSQFEEGNTVSTNLLKYLKLRKFFRKDEQFRVIDQLHMHCFPEDIK